MALNPRPVRQLVAVALWWTCLAVSWQPSEAPASPPVAPAPDPPVAQSPADGRLHGASFRAPLALEEWTHHKSADDLHPDGTEQQFMWFMNRARANPPAEGAWLADTGDADVEGAIAFFGVDLGVMQDEFDAITAKPPAAFDIRLYEAARAHSERLIADDAQDHDGQFAQITAAGFAYTQAAGIVFSYMRSPVHGYAAFAIDWGADGGDGTGMQPGRGHRQAIMSTGGDYANVGVAAVTVEESGKSVGPMVTTGNFCKADPTVSDHHNRFLVGTVWQDANANDQYDPGEGLGGITVMPDGGDFYAVTAASGGYAVPILAAGTYTVTFSGTGLDTALERSALVGDASVLLDLRYDPAAGGIQAVTRPASDVTATTATLNGTVIPDGSTVEYYFEYGLTAAYGSMTAAHTASTQSEVAAPLEGLEQATTYHFRLVASGGGQTSYGSGRQFQTAAAGSPSDDGQTVAPPAGGSGGGGCFIGAAGR